MLFYFLVKDCLLSPFKGNKEGGKTNKVVGPASYNSFRISNVFNKFTHMIIKEVNNWRAKVTILLKFQNQLTRGSLSAWIRPLE